MPAIAFAGSKLLSVTVANEKILVHTKKHTTLVAKVMPQSPGHIADTIKPNYAHKVAARSAKTVILHSLKGETAHHYSRRGANWTDGRGNAQRGCATSGCGEFSLGSGVSPEKKAA